MVTELLTLWREPCGISMSLNFNRTYGRWRVRYADGRVAQPLCRDVAEVYARIFGGEVVRVEEE